MSEFVRAKCLANDVESTIPAAWLKTEPDAWKRLNKPALAADGTHLPPKVPAPLADLKPGEGDGDSTKNA